MKIQRKYWPVWVLILVLFCSWAAWGIVLNKTSPFSSPEVAIPLFYGTSFLCVMMTICTFFCLLRLAFFQNQVVAHHVHVSLRQGIIFAFVFLCGMIFQQHSILTPFITVMIFTMGMLVEGFFYGRK